MKKLFCLLFICLLSFGVNIKATTKDDAAYKAYDIIEKIMVNKGLETDLTLRSKIYDDNNKVGPFNFDGHLIIGRNDKGKVKAKSSGAGYLNSLDLDASITEISDDYYFDNNYHYYYDESSWYKVKSGYNINNFASFFREIIVGNKKVIIADIKDFLTLLGNDGVTINDNGDYLIKGHIDAAMLKKLLKEDAVAFAASLNDEYKNVRFDIAIILYHDNSGFNFKLTNAAGFNTTLFFNKIDLLSFTLTAYDKDIIIPPEALNAPLLSAEDDDEVVLPFTGNNNLILFMCSSYLIISLVTVLYKRN